MGWVIGPAGYAFFDYWFLAHLSFWFVTGSTIAALKLNRLVVGAVCMGAALLWEIFEKFAEKKWPEIWLSPETWWNCWVSDPLTVVVGLGVAFLGFDRWRGLKK